NIWATMLRDLASMATPVVDVGECAMPLATSRNGLRMVQVSLSSVAVHVTSTSTVTELVSAMLIGWMAKVPVRLFAGLVPPSSLLLPARSSNGRCAILYCSGPDRMMNVWSDFGRYLARCGSCTLTHPDAWRWDSLLRPAVGTLIRSLIL